MAVTFEWLNTTIRIAATAAAHVTAGADETLHVNGILLHNSHSASLTVTLYCVPDDNGSAGTASGANQFYKKTLTTLQTVVINDLNFYLKDEGDSIQAVAGTANLVNIFVFGAVEDRS